MFILDSLMISGIRWALETTLTAAEAEMNDDSVLREQLLEAEMRREMGEISDEEFRDIESDLLARLREIKERREGGSGPLAFGGQPIAARGDDTFQVEATVSGDFHDPAAAPHTTVLPLDEHHAVANLVGTSGEETIALLDMEPGGAVPAAAGSQAAAAGSASPTMPHTKKRRARAARPVRVGRVPRPSTMGKPSRAAADGRSRPGRAPRTRATPRSRRRKHS